MSTKAESDFSDDEEFLKLCQDLIRPKPETIVISSDNESFDHSDVKKVVETSSPELNDPNNRRKKAIIISNTFFSI